MGEIKKMFRSGQETQTRRNQDNLDQMDSKGRTQYLHPQLFGDRDGSASRAHQKSHQSEERANDGHSGHRAANGSAVRQLDLRNLPSSKISTIGIIDPSTQFPCLRSQVAQMQGAISCKSLYHFGGQSEPIQSEVETQRQTPAS